MLPYRHTQIGWVIIIGLTVPSLVAWAMRDLVAELADPAAAWLLPGFIGLMVLLMVMFGSLTVEVDEERILIRFGPGVVRKRWSAAEIESAEVVRTKLWHGWGIHLTPQGWLYNVSGFDAIRIRLVGGKSKLIGTDEPAHLLGALHAAGVPMPAEEST